MVPWLDSYFQAFLVSPDEMQKGKISEADRTRKVNVMAETCSRQRCELTAVKNVRRYTFRIILNIYSVRVFNTRKIQFFKMKTKAPLTFYCDGTFCWHLGWNKCLAMRMPYAGIRRKKTTNIFKFYENQKLMRNQINTANKLMEASKEWRDGASYISREKKCFFFAVNTK